MSSSDKTIDNDNFSINIEEELGTKSSSMFNTKKIVDEESLENTTPYLKSLLSTNSPNQFEVWEEPTDASLNEIQEDLNAWTSLDEAEIITDDPVRMYLREIGKVELLNAEGERNLARIIEIVKYLNDTKSLLLLANQDEEIINVQIIRNTLAFIASNAKAIHVIYKFLTNQSNKDLTLSNYLNNQESHQDTICV